MTHQTKPMARQTLDALRKNDPETARLSKEDLFKTLSAVGETYIIQDVEESTGGVNKAAIERMLRDDAHGTQTHVRDPTARVSGDVLKQLQALSEPQRGEQTPCLGTQRMDVSLVLARDLAWMNQRIDQPPEASPPRAHGPMVTTPLAANEEEACINFPERTIPNDLVLLPPSSHSTRPMDTQGIVSSLSTGHLEVDPELQRQNDFLAKIGMSGACPRPSMQAKAQPSTPKAIAPAMPPKQEVPLASPSRAPQATPRRRVVPPSDPSTMDFAHRPSLNVFPPLKAAEPSIGSTGKIRKTVKLVAVTGIALMMCMLVMSIMLRVFVLT